ncbi:MAG: YCF48-related protein [Bacteroidales bacterium]
MKKGTLLLVILVLAITAFSQVKWISPSPTGNHLHAVEFINEQNGWIAGDFGTLLRSENGGSDWELVSTPLKVDLYDLFFLDGNHGWAAGDSGSIVKYLNGNWQLVRTGYSDILRAVAFGDQLNGVACGTNGLILTTSDGGDNWEKVDTGLDVVYDDICYATDSLVFMVGGSENYGQILKSADGGKSWQVNLEGSPEHITTIQFVDSTTGYAGGGDNLMLKTVDGGETWTSLNPPGNADISSIQFIDKQVGLVVDFSLNLIKTTDGGATWEQTNTVDQKIYAVTKTSGQHMVLVGYGGRIFSSSDFGITLEDHYQTLGDFRHLFHFDDMIIALGYYESLARSADGQEWIVEEMSPWNSCIPDIADYYSKDVGISAAFGGNYVFWKTVDGGETWNTMNNSRGTQYYGEDAYMKSPNVAFIVGYVTSGSGVDQHLYYKCSNGSDWDRIFLTGVTNIPLLDIEFVNDNLGFITGYEGTLLQTTDGGDNWELKQPVGPYRLTSISFTDVDTGFITGYSPDIGNVIYKTEDGSESWTIVYQDSLQGYFQPRLTQLKFYGSKAGYVIGTYGIVLHTNDGGGSWERMPSFTDYYLTDIVLLNDTSGVICGENGFMVSFGKVDPSNDEVQQQNKLIISPNPFTEIFTISFFNPDAQQIALEMFDRSGRLVYTLSRFMKAGNARLIIEDFPKQRTGTFLYKLSGKKLKLTGKILKFSR